MSHWGFSGKQSFVLYIVSINLCQTMAKKEIIVTFQGIDKAVSVQPMTFRWDVKHHGGSAMTGINKHPLQILSGTAFSATHNCLIVLN